MPTKLCSIAFAAALALLAGAEADAAPATSPAPVPSAPVSSAKMAVPAPAPAVAPPKVASSPAMFPAKVNPKYASQSAGQGRMHTCLDQYNANKATHANGGMEWIQKGGGYYSTCTKKLKG